MSLPLYMDVHVRRAVTSALHLREVDVLTAQQDGSAEWDDPDLLDRAGRLGRVVFSQDEDFLIEAARRQRDGIPFSGVVYAHQMCVSVRQCIEDLELIAKAGEPADMINRVLLLPLR